MRLCKIQDIKNAFMTKTDLSEEEIQTIIDEIPTGENNLIKRLEKLKDVEQDDSVAEYVSTRF